MEREEETNSLQDKGRIEKLAYTLLPTRVWLENYPCALHASIGIAKFLIFACITGGLVLYVLWVLEVVELDWQTTYLILFSLVALLAYYVERQRGAVEKQRMHGETLESNRGVLEGIHSLAGSFHSYSPYVPSPMYTPSPNGSPIGEEE